MNIANATREQLTERLATLNKEYDAYKALGLSLNMARGKPAPAQLELSAEMLDPDLLGDFKADDGMDIRNYGGLDGIPECKSIFAEILGVEAKNLIIFGNSSLNVMYDYVSQCMMFGAGAEPWCAQEGIKFLCPVPGYDRHFGILEHFGIEMINIPSDENGPDMTMIEELVKDEKVKGIICVPMYSNPTGYTYSDETVRRFAALKPAARDFRVIWDNAYCVHHLTDTPDTLMNLLEEAKKKLNEKRHAAFFGDKAGIERHMLRHAEILRPKFDSVLSAFDKHLAGKGIAAWTKPNGGYFISLDVYPGCAKRTVQLCKEAGVTLTGAGATYPYGKDPEDKNIRIAPTFPSRDELCKAVEILCLCVEISAVEKKLN